MDEKQVRMKEGRINPCLNCAIDANDRADHKKNAGNNQPAPTIQTKQRLSQRKQYETKKETSHNLRKEKPMHDMLTMNIPHTWHSFIVTVGHEVEGQRTNHKVGDDV